MKKLNNYDKAKSFTSGSEKLPIGGYVLKILDVDYLEYDWGDVILLSFDIDEGEYKGFYQQNFEAQTQEDPKWKGTYRLRVPSDDEDADGWKMRRFKTTISAFEESNPGYHWNWDEKELKGKLIGGIFNNKEYEVNGRHGFYTNCYGLETVEKIRSGKYKVPGDTFLKNSDYAGGGSEAPSTSEWMNAPASDTDSVPFD